MSRTRTAYRAVVGLLVGMLWIAGPLAAAEFEELADELRIAMAQRDLPAAKKKLAEVKQSAQTDQQKQVAERLGLLHDYLYDFWKSVDEGGRSLQGTEELKIGDKPVAVVEYDPATSKLVLRVDGQNKRYTLYDMPPRVAMTLASRVLKAGAAQNEAYIGTFLAMDAKGDRQLARQAWERAGKAGVNVQVLLPELEIPLPGAAKIQLPVLTPATAQVLRPQFWSLATPQAKDWKRVDLDKQGEQNSQGRLELSIPEDAGETVWLTFKRKVPASFGVRMYLTDLPAGQKFGLFSGNSDEPEAFVELPSGIVKIEFARRGEDFQCRINDEEQAVTVPDKRAARASSFVGFTLPAGASATIAGCEFAGQ